MLTIPIETRPPAFLEVRGRDNEVVIINTTLIMRVSTLTLEDKEAHICIEMDDGASVICAKHWLPSIRRALIGDGEQTAQKGQSC
jgi:hypothetical protein